MSLFGLLRDGSGPSIIRSPFMILSHSLARLERMRSNLPPTGAAELGRTSTQLILFWRVSHPGAPRAPKATLLTSLIIFSPAFHKPISPKEGDHAPGVQRQPHRTRCWNGHNALGAFAAAGPRKQASRSNISRMQAIHSIQASASIAVGLFQHPAGLERACEGSSPILRPVAWPKYHRVASLR